VEKFSLLVRLIKHSIGVLSMVTFNHEISGTYSGQVAIVSANVTLRRSSLLKLRTAGVPTRVIGMWLKPKRPARTSAVSQILFLDVRGSPDD
jgi:hypothetical protein